MSEEEGLGIIRPDLPLGHRYTGDDYGYSLCCLCRHEAEEHGDAQERSWDLKKRRNLRPVYSGSGRVSGWQWEEL